MIPNYPGRSTNTSRRRVILTSEVWIRRIQVAEGYEPFRDFSCGHGEKEKKVSAMITGRFNGQGLPAIWLVMETGYGKLVGVCGYYGRPLTYDPLPTPKPSVLNTTVTVPNAAYIHVLAIKEEFRGMILPGGIRLGSFLLNHTQGHISRAWGEMPYTWAYVDEHNEPSQALFTENGFGYVPPQTKGEDCKRVRTPTQHFAELPVAPPPWESHPLIIA
jgi:ribosomal protein S18 acetylase RimI-like enzyme